MYRYLDDGSERCSNMFQNSCHQDAICDDTTGTIACSCKDGFKDKVIELNNKIKYQKF